jgi:hypothetical protein
MTPWCGDGDGGGVVFLTNNNTTPTKVVGPSGVRVLPLAAGINEGGHYFRYSIPLLVVSIVQLDLS